jgi:trimeric autotransporter adhesin
MKTSLSLIAFMLACFALLPVLRAVDPPPDGGYPGQNTAEGEDALFSLTTGVNNTAIGFNALYNDVMGSQNTATGAQTLVSNTFGSNNAAFGFQALYDNTRGGGNTAVGCQALEGNTTGNRNTATGLGALEENTAGNLNTANGFNALYYSTGSNNIGLGANGGVYLTTGSHNIDIGNSGIPNDTRKIRIGTPGVQTGTFIAGIYGVAVTGSPVVVNSGGNLGVSTSSVRFKDQIKPMDEASEAILALKPVMFRYKKELDPDRTPQFGLVAEDVAKVNPDLVVRDAEGKVYTVRYDAVNAMLLNEFLKEHRKVQEQDATIAQVKTTAAKQEATIARQQKQIEALTAGLQKVSAQLQVSKPAPRTAANRP